MQELTLENWQAHKKTVIKLAPTMTAITGQSHHGKSSVIRAVAWMRDNKPKNPRFIRKGSGRATVTIDSVRHERTEKTNKYWIDGKKDPFTALRGAVPDEVTEALSLGPDNIQGQHDKIFLLDDSPGKVAQKLSALVDLESTTVALKYIAQRKRTAKGDAESLKKLIQETEAQIEKLAHVDEADSELAEIESEGTAIELLRKKHTKVSSVLESASQLTEELEEIPDTAALEPARKLEKQYTEWEDLQTERHLLNNTLGAIKQLQKELLHDTGKLTKRGTRLIKLYDKREDLQYAINNAESISLEIEDLLAEEKELQTKKDELLEGSCPLCGRS